LINAITFISVPEITRTPYKVFPTDCSSIVNMYFLICQWNHSTYLWKSVF